MTTTLDTVTVANRLRPVLLQLNRHLRRELAPLGITGGQAALLHVVRTSPGIGVGELAVREGVSTAAMSTALTRLESAGLLGGASPPPPCPPPPPASRARACCSARARRRTAAGSDSS